MLHWAWLGVTICYIGIGQKNRDSDWHEITTLSLLSTSFSDLISVSRDPGPTLLATVARTVGYRSRSRCRSAT